LGGRPPRCSPATKPSPFRGLEQAAHHLEGGALAGPVGAQEAEDLPAADGKAVVFHGREGRRSVWSAPGPRPWGGRFPVGRAFPRARADPPPGPPPRRSMKASSKRGVHRHDFGVRSVAEGLRVGLFGPFGQDQAQGTHPAPPRRGCRGTLQNLRQQAPPAAPPAPRAAEDPSVQAAGQISGRPPNSRRPSLSRSTWSHCSASSR
jgi:hypothetical protein